jgi:membrane-associated phospholipid phosphatase
MSRLLHTALPTTLVAAAVAAVLVLADSAREHDGLSAQVDPRIAADALDARTGLLTHVATLLTLIGSEAVVGALALGLMILLLERRGPFFAVCAAAAMAVSAGLTVGVKLLVERARPGEVDRLGPLDTTYSFPSGHTLNSAVFLGLVVLLLVPLIRDRRQRIAAGVGAGLLGFGIGLSRVYLGYHWATDVMASWLIALALLTLVNVAVRLWGPRVDRRFRSDSSHRPRLA